MKRAMQGSGVLLMKITVNFTVHIYAEERLCDELLIPHSENYGIVGEEIIEPLRIINNRSIMFEVENSVSIKEFYQLIRRHIYSEKNNRMDMYGEEQTTLDFVEEYDVLEIYFLKNGLRYSIVDKSKNLEFYMQKLGISNTIDIQILVSSDAGAVFEDHGIRFYINSREGKRHNEKDKFIIICNHVNMENIIDRMCMLMQVIDIAQRLIYLQVRYLQEKFLENI